MSALQGPALQGSALRAIWVRIAITGGGGGGGISTVAMCHGTMLPLVTWQEEVGGAIESLCSRLVQSAMGGQPITYYSIAGSFLQLGPSKDFLNSKMLSVD